jgi:hypothetical protein
MPPTRALTQRNISRARYSLPYLSTTQRDLITLIPALLSAGSPSCGIHGHAFTAIEQSLLETYFPEHDPVLVERLADRVMLESIIALPRPNPAHPGRVAVQIIAVLKPEADEPELVAKLKDSGDLLEDKGLFITPTVLRPPLPPRLGYDIMRLGVVLAGKHPVVRTEEQDDATIFIGTLTSVEHGPMPPERGWSVFAQALEDEIQALMASSSYSMLFTIPSANPYLLPYLPVLNHHEELFNTEQLEKLRICLHYLFADFPPTRDDMARLAQSWKLPPLTPLERLSVQDSLRMRLWLIPADDDELPICMWPPPAGWSQDEIHLHKSGDHWGFSGLSLFRHRYPWVILAWGGLTGSIGQHTYIHRHGLRLRRDARDHLLRMTASIGRGVDIIVPPDHAQGSIRLRGGRFYYSDAPFALLDQGIKFSLDLDEPVIRKAMLDDTGLEYLLKKGEH